MTLDAGALDRRLIILRAPSTDDGFSSDDGEHVEIGRRWAKKTDVSDGEQIAAAAQGQVLTSRFVVRWNSLTSTITGADRLWCDGTTYEVTGTKEVGGRRDGIEITAKALKP